MISLINEEKSLWEFLKETKKPIFIYGMGDGAVKIISVLGRLQIAIAGIYASDEYVRGHSFNGYLVKNFSQVKEENSEFISLLAFATQTQPLLSHIYDLSEEYEFYAPDVPVVKVDDEIFDLEYIKKHEAEFDFVYEHLGDELSRQVFIDVLNFKVSGKLSYLKRCTTPISEVYQNLIKPTSNEHYVDLGAYNGDTIIEFLSYSNGAELICGFEPDKKNFEKLNRNLTSDNIMAECHNIGAWSDEDTLYFQGGKGGRNSHLSKVGKVAVNVNSVDNILGGRKATVIKFDVEGAEMQALSGCKSTIKTYKPRLMVSAYHKNDDLFRLPIEILKICPSYKMYLRHHPYVPAWETNYYFV